MNASESLQVKITPQIQPVYDKLSEWLFGVEDTLRGIFIALLSGGHVLLEGPPGTAKTLIVKLLGQCFNCPFNRIQFTPDLMPADLIGTNIFNLEDREFKFNPGPIFTSFLLADEINRAPAKTQSALLECMQERQVTVDTSEYTLSQAFTVFATQNPLEHDGTYPLPEAQLDRFLFKIVVPYPDYENEMQLIKKHHQQEPGSTNISIAPVMTEDKLLMYRQEANNSTIQDSILDYILKLIKQSREHPNIAVGGSPRASILWAKAAKACAYLNERDYVIPDDVKYVGKPLLRHRIILNPQAELEGKTADTIIDELLMKVEPPR